PATLATKRSRGGGPPYRRWGRIPVYAWGDALKWAQSRLGEPRCSTSEEEDAISSPASSVPQTRPSRKIDAAPDSSANEALQGPSWRAIADRAGSTDPALRITAPHGPTRQRRSGGDSVRAWR